jgi:hypothetical protein
MNKPLYTYVFRSELSEIIKLGDSYRLLCYDITKNKEDKIMLQFAGILTQTSSVEVEDEDPLQGISWFSADFSEEHLETITDFAIKEDKWTRNT